MKQTVIDILIYLFENYMDEEIDLEFDQQQIKSRLKEAGFDHGQVTKALDWLEDLSYASQNEIAPQSPSKPSTRIFSETEEAKLDTECRGFLYFLEQVGVLDTANRELVIDRVMALGNEEIDIEQLKWVVLMVMFNQPGYEHTLAWMEDVVMDDVYGFVH